MQNESPLPSNTGVQEDEAAENSSDDEEEYSDSESEVEDDKKRVGDEEDKKWNEIKQLLGMYSYFSVWKAIQMSLNNG